MAFSYGFFMAFHGFSCFFMVFSMVFVSDSWAGREDNLLDGSSLTSKDPVAAGKAKVQHLCSIQKWPPNVRVAEMLGGAFNKVRDSTWRE